MAISFSKKKTKTSGKNRAFLTAVALCCAAVGLVAWSSAINNSKKPADYKVEDLPMQEHTDEPIEWYDSDSEAVFHEQEPTSPISTTIAEETIPTTVPTQPIDTSIVPVIATVTPTDTAPIAEPAYYQLPVSGGIITKFSGTELIYSKTMCDWRVHQGVDIECAAGTAIASSGSGTVYDITEDPLYGTTVIVELPGNKTLYYCGLESSSITVKKGQVLKAGDSIGTIGIVPCEAADGIHLHLAMTKDGAHTDPISGLGIE
ncbi:MAG: M23 family metallopeptidase [Clostridia bacterium]|nr:M23 family metallopeptidase [Clostridia bacterium]